MKGHCGVARARDGTELYYETYGERANPAVFLGPHFYPSRADAGLTDRWLEGLAEEFFLIMADYPRGIGRTGNPQALGFSAALAVEEYELIADDAALECFAWIGYSFGGAMGVQMACRSKRLRALVVGGFPPLEAPYAELLEVSRHLADHPPALPPHLQTGVLLSAVGFYESLLGWDERGSLSRLSLPRLVFMGESDAAQGCPWPLGLADRLRETEHELRSLGWQIVWLEDRDHVSGMTADAALPCVLSFLHRAWRS